MLPFFPLDLTIRRKISLATALLSDVSTFIGGATSLFRASVLVFVGVTSIFPLGLVFRFVPTDFGLLPRVIATIRASAVTSRTLVQACS